MFLGILSNVESHSPLYVGITASQIARMINPCDVSLVVMWSVDNNDNNDDDNNNDNNNNDDDTDDDDFHFSSFHLIYLRTVTL